MINVAVSGAAGRMGQTVCDAVEGADDMASWDVPIPSRPCCWRLGDATWWDSRPRHRPRERTN